MISSRQTDPRPLLQLDSECDKPAIISTNINNIFAGLTFPEVPKNPIINIRGNNSRTTAIEDCVALSTHSEHHEEFEYKKITPPSYLETTETTLPWNYQPIKNSIHSTQTITSTNITSDLNSIDKSSLQKSAATSTITKFSGLYSSELTMTPGLYPTLPELTTTCNTLPPAPLAPSKSPYEILSVNNINTSNSSYYEDPTSTIHDMSSMYPSLSLTDDVTSQEKPITHGRIDTPSTTTVEDPNQMYNDLLNENERLQLQLENLQKSMTTSQPATRYSNTTATRLPSSTSHPTAAPATTTTATVEAQARIDLLPPPTSTTRSTITSNQINNTNDLPMPAATSKFVCCGKCKQWLQSPKEAVYVYCPKCEAINDCGLVSESKLATGSADSKATRPPTRRLESKPWYQQCFARVMS